MKRILLVDDSPSVVTAAYDELEDNGYMVEVAYDGQEAIDYLEDNPEELPDLIVMDIEMPRLKGDEVAKIICTNSEWKHIPIIALTGKAPESMSDSLPFFNDYLVKPFGFDQLLEAVEKMIGKSEGEE